jgi:hypothetical protein
MPPRQRLSLIVSCIIAIWCRLPAIPTVCAAMPGWRCHRAQSRQRFENEADPEAPTMKRGCIEMMSRPFLRGVSQIQLTKVAQIQLTKVAQIRVALTALQPAAWNVADERDPQAGALPLSGQEQALDQSIAGYHVALAGITWNRVSGGALYPPSFFPNCLGGGCSSARIRSITRSSHWPSS